jgi:glycosyltransferase involved in cell wall biosynthesis
MSGYMTHSEPFVSVVTPVYNGERYLAECIESVLGQTYSNFEYLIVNNCSDDDTLNIAENYSNQDKRIKIFNNDKFLDLIDNWNNAIEKMSPDSKYCKVIHADDLMFPECIEKMVSIAEKEPSVGIVGSYVLRGSKVVCDGISFGNNIIYGKEVIKSSLLKKYYVFGSPTTTLVRSDIVRAHSPFYNPKFIHADVEVCYRVLENSDFGFVHQVLTYTRLHKESVTDRITKRYNTGLIEFFEILLNYGPHGLNKEEYDRLLKKRKYRFYRILAKKLFENKSEALLKNTKEHFKELNIKFDHIRFFAACLIELFDLFISPRKIAKKWYLKENK